jgi:hypothetical protein
MSRSTKTHLLSLGNALGNRTHFVVWRKENGAKGGKFLREHDDKITRRKPSQN